MRIIFFGEAWPVVALDFPVVRTGAAISESLGWVVTSDGVLLTDGSIGLSLETTASVGRTCLVLAARTVPGLVPRGGTANSAGRELFASLMRLLELMLDVEQVDRLCMRPGTRPKPPVALGARLVEGSEARDLVDNRLPAKLELP